MGAVVGGEGTTFHVWAPRPRAIELEVDGRRIPVERDAAGCAATFVPGVRAGARYAYLLDGERRRPDPASRLQPDGVHGPSEVVDPRAFAWHDGEFRAPPVDCLYELHVGTFSRAGTFAGAVERLDELVATGFRWIELMPVNHFAGARGWGYDGVLWLAVHPAYGGPTELARLVDAAHARGMGVVLDVVFNHLGHEGNYWPEFADVFADAPTPWGRALDLDAAGVRRHIVGTARALVGEYHLDGLRFDAVHAFVDRSPVHIVAEATAALEADAVRRGRPVVVIAESDLGSTVPVEPTGEGGWGCDAAWIDDLHHALHAAVTGERHGYYADFGAVADVARALERGMVQSGRRSTFRDGSFGEPAAHLDGRRFVVCAQNHDQVGNRALGERLSVLRPGCEHAVAAVVLASPFLPLVFMGEEHGETAPFPFFSDFQDPGLARAVTDGRRREYGAGAPDPQAEATFAGARVDHARAGARGDALRRWYRALLGLRRSRPSLGSTVLGRTEAVADGETLIVRRTAPFDETLVAVRLAATPGATQVPNPRRGAWRTLVDAGDHGGPHGARLVDGKLLLPAWGALLLGAP